MAVAGVETSPGVDTVVQPFGEIPADEIPCRVEGAPEVRRREPSVVVEQDPEREAVEEADDHETDSGQGWPPPPRHARRIDLVVAGGCPHPAVGASGLPAQTGVWSPYLTAPSTGSA